MIFDTLLKYIKDGKVLDHLGFKSKVLPGHLTGLSAWVGFYTSSPQQGVKCQLWYFEFFFVEGVGAPHLKFKTSVFLPLYNMKVVKGTM
jgi:hypothetical protein